MGGPALRRIGVVTVGRSDFGLYLPLLRKIEADRGLMLQLFVSGAHLESHHGHTVRDIRAQGFRRIIPVPMLEKSDLPVGITDSMGKGVAGFGRALDRHRPEILVVLGDRFEMHAAALAALPFNIPVAHIHGGELTEGAIDDALRHSITKLSHLHFASTKEYAQRIKQLGEERWRVRVVGALGLDNLREIEIQGRLELGRRLGGPLPAQFVLATFHPVTLEFKQADGQIQCLLAALSTLDIPVIFTAPNADTNGSVVARRIRAYVGRHPGCRYVENMGTQSYFSAMTEALVMVGNSSSGIIEAASFGLPVVNVGTRQDGRLRSGNVIDCGYATKAVVAALRRATSPAFRAASRRKVNRYDAGGAAGLILSAIKAAKAGDRLLRKKFIDLGRQRTPV